MMKKAAALLLSVMLLGAVSFTAFAAPEDDTTDEPVYEEPVEDPVEEPVEDPVEDPVEEPVEDPVEDPVEEPSYEESYYEEPSYEESYYEEPSYEESYYEEPSYEESYYEEPSYEESYYEEPSYEESYYEEPSYEEPDYTEYADESYYDNTWEESYEIDQEAATSEISTDASVDTSEMTKDDWEQLQKSLTPSGSGSSGKANLDALDFATIKENVDDGTSTNDTWIFLAIGLPLILIGAGLVGTVVVLYIRDKKLEKAADGLPAENAAGHEKKAAVNPEKKTDNKPEMNSETPRPDPAAFKKREIIADDKAKPGDTMTISLRPGTENDKGKG